jgi:hypothetical protein
VLAYVARADPRCRWVGLGLARVEACDVE